ncbi:MAG: HAD hydrolase-like protein [archaeon]|nr:HAD hydrolase-like protein [archaeon]
MGLAKPVALRELLRIHGRACQEADVERLHGRFVGEMVRFYSRDPRVREVPGASEAFSALRAGGVKVALNSGFSRPIMQAIVDRLRWQTAIDGFIGSDQVPTGRPAPDMVRALMRLHGVSDPRAVAKVGDTPADLREGFSAGCGLNIAVLSGACSLAELTLFSPSLVLDSVRDLPTAIFNSSSSNNPAMAQQQH